MEKNYAIIKDGNVINTVVFDDPSPSLIEHFKNEYEADLIIEAGNNAAIYGTYDGSKFWKPQPFPSWVKNEELNQWEAPVPVPDIDPENPKFYVWNEEIVNWEERKLSGNI